MQLALLSGASPLTCKNGPTVRLQAGTWEFFVDGLNDSILILHQDSHESRPIKNGYFFTLFEACAVNASFVERGSEKHITVNVKKVA